MKYYKLLKDLPTFNKGDLFCRADVGGLWHCAGPKGYMDVMAYHQNTLEKFPNILEDWFEEIKEPLIKDEKIRKCVKLWAKLNEYNDTLMYAEDEEWCAFYEDDEQNELLFGKSKCVNLQNQRYYTIAELCGEEEEDE